METTAVDQFAELLGVQVLLRSFDEARCWPTGGYSLYERCER